MCVPPFVRSHPYFVCRKVSTWWVLIKTNKQIDSGHMGMEWKLVDARRSFSDLSHAHTKYFRTPREQQLSLLTEHHTIFYAEKDGILLGWLWPRNKEPIDTDHMCMKWWLRGWLMPEEASQILPMQPTSIYSTSGAMTALYGLATHHFLYWQGSMYHDSWPVLAQKGTNWYQPCVYEVVSYSLVDARGNFSHSHATPNKYIESHQKQCQSMLTL